ncbi:MAG: hypothetical protein V4532_11665, partial [Pseudomonadota bacterium]
MANIEFRKSTPADRGRILEILRVNAPHVPQELRVKLFDWQFGHANPHSDGRATFWLAVVDGEVSGVNGLVPVKLRYKGQNLLGAWSCDTLVPETHRGMGLGKGLLAKMSQEAAVVMAYGISDMSDTILVKLGWEINPDCRGLFYYVAEKGLKGLIKNTRSALPRWVNRPPQQPGLEIKTNESQRFGDEIDALWCASEAGYHSTVVRDAAYLNWRYRDHPCLHYVAYEARRAGVLVAVMIARHDAVESVIVDYCGPTEHEAEKGALLEAAVTDLSGRGTQRIRCETTDAVLLKLLGRSGFRQTNADFRFRAWSNQLGDSNLGVNWFLTAGDSDNDSSMVAKLAELRAGPRS